MIIDYYNYVMGDKAIGAEPVSPVRCNSDVLSDFIKEVNKCYTAAQNMQATDSAKRFFAIEPDIAHFTPKEYRQEVFYAYKCGSYSPVIPSKYLFMLSKCKSKYLSMNMFTKVIPKKDLQTLFTSGCIADGYSLYDVIKSLYDKEFHPLGETKLSNKRSDYTELYIREKDMVALVPNKIGEALSDADINRLQVVGKDICLGDVPIKTLGGYYGVCNSTYDLRENV